MLDVVAGIMVMFMILAGILLFMSLGVCAGLLVERILDGKYVDPTKIRHCKDICDDYE